MKQHTSEIGLTRVEGSELRGHVFHARPVPIIPCFRRIFRTPSLSSASFEEVRGFVERNDLPPDLSKKILWDNPKRLYRI